MSKAISHALLFILISSSLSRAQETQPSSIRLPASSVESPVIEPAVPRISYFVQARLEPRPLSSLMPAQLSMLEKLNRVNASRLARLDAVVIPDTWVNDELAYSPFPRDYAWAADKPTAIVVDQPAQAFGAYEYGRLVRWGPVSTGASGQTPSGLFQLSWRSPGHHSSIDPTWYMEWYFNFIPSRGIAFHKYSLPGRAASHGCVRMLERDAYWLYEWGQAARKGSPGTTVVVLGCPDATRPWRSAEYLTSGIILPEVPSRITMDCWGYSGATPATQRRTVR